MKFSSRFSYHLHTFTILSENWKLADGMKTFSRKLLRFKWCPWMKSLTTTKYSWKSTFLGGDWNFAESVASIKSRFVYHRFRLVRRSFNKNICFGIIQWRKRFNRQHLIYFRSRTPTGIKTIERSCWRSEKSLTLYVNLKYFTHFT